MLPPWGFTVSLLPLINKHSNVKGQANECYFTVAQPIYSSFLIDVNKGGHGGRVLTLSPPTSEGGVRFPARPQVGKLAVACCWSVYSIEH